MINILININMRPSKIINHNTHYQDFDIFIVLTCKIKGYLWKDSPCQDNCFSVR